jgi:hypothetical protein
MDLIVKILIGLGALSFGFLAGWATGSLIAGIRNYDDRFDIWYEDEW